MIEENPKGSPNAVGLLAGLLTIPVLFGSIAVFIWILMTLLAFFSQWSTVI